MTDEDFLLRAGPFKTLLGGVSDMFICRRLKDDPDFPKPLYIGGLRYWRHSEAVRYIESRPRENAARVSRRP